VADTGRFDPLAIGIDMRGGDDGADDGVRGDLDHRGLFDDVGERGTNAGAAAVEKSGGVGVAIDGGVVGDAVVGGDGVRAAPVEVVLLDKVAVGMAADGALALVAREGGARPPPLSLLRPARLACVAGVAAHIRFPWGVKNAPTYANAKCEALSIVGNTDTQNCGGMWHACRTCVERFVLCTTPLEEQYRIQLQRVESKTL
jgi:hypothetical protein